MGIIDNSTGPISTIRPRVQGKFIFAGDKKLYVRGVSYGGFRPNENGIEFPNQEVVERDFAQMAANGINAVRTYTTPPRELLDIAQEHDLHIMVGLTGEQFVGNLIDNHRFAEIETMVRSRVRSCAGHPAVLCYAIGNEIPASIVRWLGPDEVERYLAQLYRVIKDEDPDCLVTYVNYPTTEYLDLPFLDLLCYNVYLETQEQLKSYLPRLHNIAGDRPLLMSEIGLDSLRNGEDKQASVLKWQIRTSFEAGCAGVFVFGWTDDWHRGGADIYDWAFGLTTRDRQAKPALAAVTKAYADLPITSNGSWPLVSVVVCTYNGACHIQNCCDALSRLDYPNYEVIIVNDGSTDATEKIINDYDFKVISTKNLGLSNARNLGLEAASGEIVAYLDDDAYPDEDWLTYLASSFNNTRYAGIGGPNIAPPGDGFVSECVTNAPGNPVYVLLSDEEAEHIPGCNMAFRKADLQAIGGFDPQFHVAGDDVDVCWRLQQNGYSLGLNPAATVWHHRRGSIRAYWKQQVGYGSAEVRLKQKWPAKHNSLGHWLWQGQIYATGITKSLPLRSGKVFHGTWGGAPFQSLYNPRPGTLLSMSLMPEWYLLVLLLVGLTGLGFFWKPLIFMAPLFILVLALPISQSIASARQAAFQSEPRSRLEDIKLRSLTAILHLMQPAARLWGRIHAPPAYRRGLRKTGFCLPTARTSKFWSETWKSPEQRLESVEKALQVENLAVTRGGDYDRWDLEVQTSMMCSVRTCMAVEEHGAGRQVIRFRSWPRIALFCQVLVLFFLFLTTLAALDHAWIVATIFGVISLTLLARILWTSGTAMASMLASIEHSVSAKGK